MLKTGVTVDVLWRGLLPRTTLNSLAPAPARSSTGSVFPQSATRWRHERIQCLNSRHYSQSTKPSSRKCTTNRSSHRPYSTSTTDVETPQPNTKLLYEFIDLPADLLRTRQTRNLPKAIRTIIEDDSKIREDGSMRLRCDDILAFLRQLRDERPENSRVPEFWAQVLKPCIAGIEPLVEDALLRAQIRHEGSCEVVTHVLSDAQEAGYNPTSATYHLALRALANHPDYILRDRILQIMKSRYMELTPDGHVSVVLGLLRDGQYEMAIDKLEEVTREGIEVPTWVYDIFLFVFAELGFHDEVIRIINHQRINRQGTDLNWPSANTCYFLLDKCSKAYHYESTKLIWNLGAPKMFNPPDGVLENVLCSAAKGLDPTLGSEAIRLLATRGNKLGLHHYEPLIACYAGAGHEEKAFSVLCIMHRAGIKPDSGSTRPIYHLLKTKESHEILETVRLLFRLKSQGPVPIAAFNVTLEGMMEKKGLASAMDFYSRVRLIVKSGPDIETFNTILRMIHAETPERSLEITEFLVDEMKAIGIMPDRLTYDHVVHNLARAGKPQLALQYLQEMGRTFNRSMGRTGWITKINTLWLFKALFEAGLTQEAEDLITEGNARGLKIKDVWVELDRPALRDGLLNPGFYSEESYMSGMGDEDSMPETTEASASETSEVPVSETSEASVSGVSEESMPKTTEASAAETDEAYDSETSEAAISETSEESMPETTEVPVSETAESSMPDTIEPSVSGTTEPFVPETVESSMPEAIESSISDTSEASISDMADSSAPGSTESSMPETSEASVPKTTESSIPETTETSQL
ncbi:hypothetical protein MCOR25_000717 [Pyricularia grisea]|uniref:Pentatricopeptide repeat-containing protein-mitochondrial domain-containing protein n=1 Tax=Pyricularia grisea TaxID=148305 RepID=A0A6P8B999_PYRGI|nr:uncharacterized protein PgNI_03993 [Pyricularia grisea]KAI6382421.1 hypothetical protein MCOR25_000717 [Pyricularia grisea]TLD12415.1 hypothetical protein PgNI_03993 [Pyricularia grisea]